jgi:hypothetical protein
MKTVFVVLIIEVLFQIQAREVSSGMSCLFESSPDAVELLRRQVRYLADGVRLSFFSGRFRRAADSLFGGEPGAIGHLQVARRGKIFDLKSKGLV